MKIIVLLKEVPDTYGERRLSPESGLADRSAADPVPDEICERALEVALGHAGTHRGTEVIVLSMGPDTGSATLRKALAMGAARAVRVTDPALAGSDLGTTARVLATAIRTLGFDLVIAGTASTDGGAGMLPSMVAELLGVPSLTSLAAVDVSDSAVTGTRAFEAGSMDVAALLPAVVSITEALPDARFPTFRGIIGAKKKSLEVWALADLGIDPHEASGPRSTVVSVTPRPPRTAGTKIVDQGDAGTQVARFLASSSLL